jgi:hypothetical protein
MGYVFAKTDGKTDGLIGLGIFARWTYGQTDRWTDREMDRH